MRRKKRRKRSWIPGAVMGVILSVTAVAGWYGVRAYGNRQMAGEVGAAEAAGMAGIDEAAGGAGLTVKSGAAGTDEAAEASGDNGLAAASGQPGASAVAGDEAGAAQDASAEETADLSQSRITYKGKTYRRNTYVKAILCLGIDRGANMTEAKAVGEAGQADGIFLLAQDTAHNSLRILMIPRDTMTEVERINRDGSYRDSHVTHLNVAFAYGNGREGSCRNMSRAVSGLLGGLPMDSYMAVDVSIIPVLNDAVGGVTVTIPYVGMEKADPSFTFGSSVTLKGEMAERFIRFRDTDQHQSAIFRMSQHREYISGYFTAVKDASQKDSGIVSRLFDQMQEYMVTDMAKGEYLNIAADALAGAELKSEDFYMLPGTGVSTETFDEYHADRDAVTDMILQMFYREVS